VKYSHASKLWRDIWQQNNYITSRYAGTACVRPQREKTSLEIIMLLVGVLSRHWPQRSPNATVCNVRPKYYTRLIWNKSWNNSESSKPGPRTTNTRVFTRWLSMWKNYDRGDKRSEQIAFRNGGNIWTRQGFVPQLTQVDLTGVTRRWVWAKLFVYWAEA